MKTFYKITGVIFILGCSLLLKTSYEEIQTYRSGHMISATIRYVPNCISTKKHYNIKFIFKGKEFGKEIAGLQCKELKEGDIIMLKTNQDNSIFLYEHENPYKNLSSFVLIFLFGILLIYMGFKK